MTPVRILSHQRDGGAGMAGAEHGFSLIEVAVVLFIIVLLLGSILVPLSTQVEQRQISDTQKTLDEIREALIGFTLANGYLPCPDTGTNGTENVTAGACTTITGGVAIGRLPHRDLGLGNSDLWSNRFTYVVNAVYAQRSPATPFTLSAVGNDVQICATSACVAAAKLSTTAVFAVISHGKNGLGAVNYATNATNPVSSSADEQENYDNNDANIVSRIRFTGGAAASEFDDIVIWMSKYTLFNRMVAAGKLP
jgi:prepilin-type N-terminal cleavage/methylation domain-containing protein